MNTSVAERVDFEQWVPVPLRTVFRFFSDPRNLPRIMPDALAAELLRVDRVAPPDAGPGSREAGVGSVIVVSVRLFPPLPMRSTWVARIVEYERDRCFADVQDRGPFRRWVHRHEFEARTRDGQDGTVVRDRVEFEVGMGPLGTAASRLVVGPRMRSAFAHRHERLAALLAAAG